MQCGPQYLCKYALHNFTVNNFFTTQSCYLSFRFFSVRWSVSSFTISYKTDYLRYLYVMSLHLQLHFDCIHMPFSVLVCSLLSQLIVLLLSAGAGSCQFSANQHQKQYSAKLSIYQSIFLIVYKTEKPSLGKHSGYVVRIMHL